MSPLTVIKVVLCCVFMSGAVVNAIVRMILLLLSLSFTFDIENFTEREIVSLSGPFMLPASDNLTY